MYLLCWCFFVYAFLGWCAEVGYAALETGRFVNRGFLNGPACPIYGCGAVIVLSCLEPLKNNLPALFFGSFLLTSVLEWATGFVLEKIFHQRWWDYSEEHFNIGGYVCLKFSIIWGFACVFVVKLLHPTVLLFIRVIPRTLGAVLLCLMAAGMAVDLTATVGTIAKINRRLSEIDRLAAKMREASNGFGEDLAEKVLDAAERGADLRQEWDAWKLEAKGWAEETREKREERKAALQAQISEWKDRIQEQMDKETFGQHRLLKAFPKMRSTAYRSIGDRLRRYLERKYR